MPVRFYCCNCRQLLQISRRKIGSEVDCPRCKTRLVVPNVEPDEGEGSDQSGTDQPGSEQPKVSPKQPAGQQPAQKSPSSSQPAQQPAKPARQPAQQPAASQKPAGPAKSERPAPAPATASAQASTGGGTATATAPAETTAPAEADEDLMSMVDDEGLIPEFIVFDEPFEAAPGDSIKENGETSTASDTATPSTPAESPQEKPQAVKPQEQPPQPKSETAPPAELPTVVPVKPKQPAAKQPEQATEQAATAPVPAAKEQPPATEATAPATKPAPQPESKTDTPGKPEIKPAAKEPVPEPEPEQEGIYLNRRMVYVQAVFMLGLLFLGLGTGYWAGRGDTPAGGGSGELGVTTTTFLDGRVVYEDKNGQYESDSGSVVVAVPTDAWPDPKLPYIELRPGVPLEQATVDAVKAAGGMVAIADREGAFSLVLPKPGIYFVLVISQHTKRHLSVKPTNDDLKEMEQFFSFPEQLLSDSKFLWGQEKVESHGRTLRTHNFGVDGFK